MTITDAYSIRQAIALKCPCALIGGIYRVITVGMAIQATNLLEGGN